MTFLIMEDQQLFTYEQSGGKSSSDDIVPLNTDQPDRPRAKRRGSQCGTHWDPVFLTGKFDPILHRTDSPVNDLWVNLPVVNSWTSLPVIEGTGQSHRPNSRNRIGPDQTELGVNLQTSPRDRIGPDELGVNLQTSPPVTGQ